MRTLSINTKSIYDLELKDEISISDSKYIVRKTLRGGMGRILFLGKTGSYSHNSSDLGEYIVLKIPFKGSNSDSLLSHFKHELTIWAGFSHECIAPLIDIIDCPECGWIAVMKCHTGSLRDLMRMKSIFSLNDSFLAIRAVMSALIYAYEEFRVIHLDIKPENILYDKNFGTAADMHAGNLIRINNFKVSDWGIAAIKQKQIDDSFKSAGGIVGKISAMDKMGTIHYMAPERFEGVPSTIASDIYSLGILFIEMLTGTLPIEIECDVNYQIYQIRKLYYYRVAKDLLIKSRVHSEMQKLILSMVHPDPLQRHPSYMELSSDFHRAYKMSVNKFTNFFKSYGTI